MLTDRLCRSVLHGVGAKVIDEELRVRPQASSHFLPFKVGVCQRPRSEYLHFCLLLVGQWYFGHITILHSTLKLRKSVSPYGIDGPEYQLLVLRCFQPCLECYPTVLVQMFYLAAHLNIQSSIVQKPIKSTMKFTAQLRGVAFTIHCLLMALCPSA